MTQKCKVSPFCLAPVARNPTAMVDRVLQSIDAERGPRPEKVINGREKREREREREKMDG